MRSMTWLSPSALNLLLDCPRCFWLDKNKNIKRPRGIFPSLPGGMDLVIKKYFDSYRLSGDMPPEIKGKVAGRLFPDISILERWRNWRNSDLRYKLQFRTHYNYATRLVSRNQCDSSNFCLAGSLNIVIFVTM